MKLKFTEYFYPNTRSTCCINENTQPETRAVTRNATKDLFVLKRKLDRK